MPTSDASTQTKAISTKDAKVQAAKRKMVEQGTQTGPRVRASRKTQTELTKTDEMSQTEVRTMDSSSQTRVDDNKRGPTPPYPVQEGVKRRKEADEEPMDCTDEQDQNPDDEILETEDEVEDEEIPPDDILEWDYEVEEIEEHADPNSPDAPDSPATPPPAAVEVQREVVEDEHQRHRRQLIQELRNAIQEKTDLKCILQQFEEQPSCPERRFSRADVNPRERRWIRCVFCGAENQHYSDSCLEVSTTAERRDRLIADGRCMKCLVNGCRGGAACRRRESTCFYCKHRGHHPAICPMPEDTSELRRRISNLQKDLEDATEKVLRRRRRLARFLDGRRD
ncbi:hypothetical protein Q1695_012721 [Nippostrongylus brasiliensis]|nr:hypothetical protein Q1695_012721 [Nippostrongylus brasiliensis]